MTYLDGLIRDQCNGPKRQLWDANDYIAKFDVWRVDKRFFVVAHHIEAVRSWYMQHAGIYAREDVQIEKWDWSRQVNTGRTRDYVTLRAAAVDIAMDGATPPFLVAVVEA